MIGGYNLIMGELTTNEQAFLSMIASDTAEGTTKIPSSDGGYKALVGGGTFDNYDDHPRIRVFLQKLGIWSTAAGRYQILAKNFDYYADLLGLSDFSPDSQDAIAIRMITERHALDDIDNGNIVQAVQKVNNLWASLPGNNYGQHTASIAALLQAYTDAGGIVASTS